MTKDRAYEIETFLNKKLLPEFSYILIFGEPGQPESGIISNYNGETVVKMLKELANTAYGADLGENNNE